MSFGGIVFKQLDGGYGWGVRASKTDSKFTPHTNIVVRGNYVSPDDTQYGCNALLHHGRAARGSSSATSARTPARSAIEIYNSDDVKVQYNETFGTVQKAGGADSNGIDADRATTATIIQYNYVHDNGDGILLCQFAFGDSIVRYNVLINNKRHGINLHSDSSATNQTYNNLIFIRGPGSANLIATSGTASDDAGGRLHDPEQHPALVARGVDGRHGRWRHVQQQPVLRRDRGRQRAAVGRSPVLEQRDPPERRNVRACDAGAARGLPGANGVAGDRQGRLDHSATAASTSGATPLRRTADIGPYEAP